MQTTASPRFSLTRLTPAEVLETLTLAYRSEVERRGMVYAPRTDTLTALAATARWLTDPDDKPCLLLMGGVGTGKTSLAHAVGQLLDFVRQPIPPERRASVWDSVYRLNLRHALEIAQTAKDSPERFERLKTSPLLGIDDLGQEPVSVMDYGNSRLPAVELIEARYRYRLPTLFTTNLGGKGNGSLRAVYGDRTADRLTEICRIVPLTGESFRQTARLDNTTH